MAWQLTRSLSALRADIKRGLPNVTIYTVGDAAHRLRSSDHNPDDTSGSKAAQSDSDSSQEVRAIDIMLAVSDQSMRIVKALTDSRSRGRLAYVIHGGRIWSRSNGWAVRSFTSDPHNDHIHVSGLAADDGNAAGWPAVAELWEVDMALDAGDISAIKSAILGDGGMQMLFSRVAALCSGISPVVPNTTQANVLHQKLNALATAVAQIPEVDTSALEAQLAEIEAAVVASDTDEAAIVAGVLAGLDPAAIAEQVAAALPADQAQQVADELHARLAG